MAPEPGALKVPVFTGERAAGERRESAVIWHDAIRWVLLAERSSIGMLFPWVTGFIVLVPVMVSIWLLLSSALVACLESIDGGSGTTRVADGYISPAVPVFSRRSRNASMPAGEWQKAVLQSLARPAVTDMTDGGGTISNWAVHVPPGVTRAGSLTTQDGFSPRAVVAISAMTNISCPPMLRSVPFAMMISAVDVLSCVVDCSVI